MDPVAILLVAVGAYLAFTALITVFLLCLVVLDKLRRDS
jgi:hypothetical protein